MQLSQFNMYAASAQVGQLEVLDEVDCCKQDLMRITEYEDAKNFILNKFGNFEGAKLVAYTELNKHVYLYLDNEKVEFCAIKNKKQYWGRGWKLVYIKDDEQRKKEAS